MTDLQRLKLRGYVQNLFKSVNKKTAAWISTGNEMKKL